MHDKERQVGDALRRYLEGRGCALEGAEARRLAESLVELACAGLLVPAGADTSNRGPSNPAGTES